MFFFRVVMQVCGSWMTTFLHYFRDIHISTQLYLQLNFLEVLAFKSPFASLADCLSRCHQNILHLSSDMLMENHHFRHSLYWSTFFATPVAWRTMHQGFSILMCKPIIERKSFDKSRNFRRWYEINGRFRVMKLFSLWIFFVVLALTK